MFKNIPKSKNMSLYWDKYVFIEKLLANDGRRYKKEENLDIEILRYLNQNISQEIIDKLEERRKRIVEKFREKGQVVIDTKMRLRTRLLVGSAIPSILEIGMCLSRNYGIPIIPSSSIKGSFSNYFSDTNLLSEKEYLKVFGGNMIDPNENEKGSVIFLDAYPVSELRFSLDILNNHFQPYYMDGKIPNDWYNPVPVKYVTVGQGVFRFTLLSEEKLDNIVVIKLNIAFGDMLGRYGIGAKTSYGYGRFEKIEDVSE